MKKLLVSVLILSLIIALAVVSADLMVYRDAVVFSQGYNTGISTCTTF